MRFRIKLSSRLQTANPKSISRPAFPHAYWAAGFRNLCAVLYHYVMYPQLNPMIYLPRRRLDCYLKLRESCAQETFRQKAFLKDLLFRRDGYELQQVTEVSQFRLIVIWNTTICFEKFKSDLDQAYQVI